MIYKLAAQLAVGVVTLVLSDIVSDKIKAWKANRK